MRLMTITMEVNDEEAANLLNRFAERGEVEVTGDAGGQVATAITSPATPAAPVATTAELDDNGVPWDERYHAGTKTKNKNGTWKSRRGMTDAEKDEAEAYEESFSGSEPATPAAPAAPVAPTPPAAPVAPAAPAPVSFEELTAGFTEVIGRIGQDALMAQLGQIYADAGVPADGASLQTNETQRASVLTAIKAL